jgi:TonB family protein
VTVDWREKEQEDEQDQEFVAFLRQFRPRTPPTFRTGGLSRYVAPRPLAIASAVLLALAIPFGLSRDEPAGQNSPDSMPDPIDVELGSKPDAAVNKVRSPSTSVAAVPGPVASRPQPAPAAGANRIASPSTAGASTRAVARGGGSLRPGAPAQNGRVRVGGAIKPPVRLVNVNPVYPEDARAAGVEGLVVLQIAIGEDGSVIEALVLRSIPMLDQAAIDAVIQWVYQPTLLNGMPVEVEMTVTINFTLR